jgi:hypothetical protein
MEAQPESEQAECGNQAHHVLPPILEALPDSGSRGLVSIVKQKLRADHPCNESRPSCTHDRELNRVAARFACVRNEKGRLSIEEKDMNIDLKRALLAGITGTAVMTAVGLWVAPMIGMPPMNPATMLADAMGGIVALGWVGHFMIGIILAVIYALVASRLPGAPAVRGALFGIAPFLLAQIVVIPMMGMPIFSGSVVMAMGSLIGHLVYGAVVGVVYGPIAESQVQSGGHPATAAH